MSQIPSRASLDARRSRDRYAHCPVCKSGDVNGLHVDRCQESRMYLSVAVESGVANDVPPVTTEDLWAHLNSRTHNEMSSAAIVRLVLDLGWRPVVGSDDKRLWRSES